MTAPTGNAGFGLLHGQSLRPLQFGACPPLIAARADEAVLEHLYGEGFDAALDDRTNVIVTFARALSAAPPEANSDHPQALRASVRGNPGPDESTGGIVRSNEDVSEIRLSGETRDRVTS